MRICKKTIVATMIILSVFSVSVASEPEKSRPAFQGTRLVNLQSAAMVDPGELQLLIQHRFGDISGGLYELFGLDQASMRLGFEYGFGNHFTLGAGRSTYLKTYDVFGKLLFARQTSSFPLTIGASFTASVPTIRNVFPESDNFDRLLASHTQLHLAKTSGAFSVQVSPGFATTGTIPFLNESRKFFNLGIGASVLLSRKVSINAEYVPRFDKSLPNQNPLSVGIDIDTGGHLFQLMLSNTQHMTDQAILTGSSGKWSEGRIFFGFNLVREFKLKYE